MVFPELSIPLADALLAPHRSYLKMLQPVIGGPRAATGDQGSGNSDRRPGTGDSQSLIYSRQSTVSSTVAISNQQPTIKALAHLTGGGFIENIPRPAGEVNAVVRLGSWPVPPLFTLIQQRGGIPVQEMYRVFNMGIGMVIVAAPDRAAGLQAAIGEETWVIGEITPGSGKVVLQ